jgi:hypothetical protein
VSFAVHGAWRPGEFRQELAHGGSMRFRRWVNWLAVAAILLHAGTVARHNVIRFEAIPNELTFLAGFGAATLCRASNVASDASTGEGLPGKGQGSTSKPCPICLGMATAHALTASDTLILRVPEAVFVVRTVPRNDEAAPPLRLSLPPTRGPPGIA